MKLKIGLIGFGKWVRSAYLPALQYDGRAEVTAVTAATEKTKELARQILGPSVAVYQNYEELLAQAHVDAVMVAVPDRLHQQVLSASLKADPAVAVFYEPPISHMREQLPVMIGKFLDSDRVTFAHLELGFHPSIARARELIKNNKIGLLQKVTISLQAGWGCKGDEDLCLMDRMSCWYVDVLNRIVGSAPERVLILDGYGKAGRMQTVSTAVYDYNGVWGIFKADIGRAGGGDSVFKCGGCQRRGLRECKRSSAASSDRACRRGVKGYGRLGFRGREPRLRPERGGRLIEFKNLRESGITVYCQAQGALQGIYSRQGASQNHQNR